MTAQEMQEAHPPMADKLVEELREAYGGLSYNAIENGCVDCGLASTLASRAAESLTEYREMLEKALLLFEVAEFADTMGIDETALASEIRTLLDRDAA